MSVKSIVIKLLAGCFVIAVLVSAIYFLSKPEDEKIELLKVYSTDADSVNRIEVKGDEGFNLYKSKDGEWIMEGMEGIGVNKTYATTLVKSMTNIFSEMLVEADAENPEKYGLIKPEKEITLYSDEGEETILIGNQSGEYYYLAVRSDMDVHIVATSDLYMVFMEKIKYLDNTALLVDVNRICSVSLSDIKLEKDGEDWFETAPYRRRADANAVKTKVLDHLAEITATDIARRDEISLTDKIDINIVMDNGDELDFTVSSNGYLYHKGSDYAYCVGEDITDIISVTGFELMNKYIAPISITEVVKIEFVSPTGKTQLTIDAPSTEAPVFYKNGQETKEESFRNFYQLMMGLTFEGEGTASAAAEYAIIYTKENGEKYDVRFINATERDFAVSINGKTQFTVSKKAVTDVFDALKDIETI